MYVGRVLINKDLCCNSQTLIFTEIGYPYFLYQKPGYGKHEKNVSLLRHL